MTPRTMLLALALVAGACSSGDDSAPTSTGASSPTTLSATAPLDEGDAAESNTTTAATTSPTTSPPTTAPAATTSPVATTNATAASPDATVLPTDPTGPDLTDAEMADQELARTALIALDSFPDGWIEEPNKSDDDEEEEEEEDDGGFENQFDACLGRNDDERVGDDLEPLAVSTGDFRPVDDESTSVSHEVVLAPDTETAITAMSEVSVEGAETCIAEVIEQFYEATFAGDPELLGIEIGDVTVTRTERERPADLAVGVLLEIPLTLEGQTVSQFLEVLYQRQGRALSELTFTSLGSPFSRDGYTILSDEVVIGLAPIGN